MKLVTSPENSAPSRPAHLRQANARKLLGLIQVHTPCSKADLVRYSGLTAPTITSCVALLQKLGLVEAIGDGKSKGGRPPGLLRFNAKHGYVAAADIGGTRLRMMLGDLGGTGLAQWSRVLKVRQKTPAALCSLVQEGLGEMCSAAGLPVSRVLHLTAGAPGITDVQAGVVISAPNLTGWNDVPLRTLLQQKLGIPAIVENDTNLAAVGEHLCGAARNVDDFIFLALGTGVGSGIFLGGKLHHGSNWSAGEVGYFGVGGQPRQPMRLRNTGQLEEEIGGGGVERRWQKALGSRGEPERKRLRATQILDLAASGDRQARAVAERTASLLADAIADIALLLNPQLVILGGGVGCHPQLCTLTRRLLNRHELARQVTLRSSALGTEAQLRGAIATSLGAIQAGMLPK